MIPVELVATMAGESDDVVVAIRLFGDVVDCVPLGIVNGGPVGLARIRRDDVAVLYSTLTDR